MRPRSIPIWLCHRTVVSSSMGVSFLLTTGQAVWMYKPGKGRECASFVCVAVNAAWC